MGKNSFEQEGARAGPSSRGGRETGHTHTSRMAISCFQRCYLKLTGSPGGRETTESAKRGQREGAAKYGRKHLVRTSPPPVHVSSSRLTSVSTPWCNF